jgi:hypothetical protein
VTTLKGTVTTTTLRGMATELRGMALRGTVTATTLREGWQRNNVGVQKPKGLGRGEWRERENTMDFFFFWGGGGST